MTIRLIVTCDNVIATLWLLV